jgi:hypothetical protein
MQFVERLHYVGVRLVDDNRPVRLPPHERPTAQQLANRARSMGRQ